MVRIWYGWAIWNQSLKEHKKESIAGGGLTNILRTKIKAILRTEIRKILNQTQDSEDEIILLSGKGASDTYGPKLNKEKGVLSMLEDTEDDCEFYQEELPQSLFGVVSIDESELIMEN